MPRETERHVQSVVSAVQLLDAFDRDCGLALKDLHERTGLNRSRILRFAGTLQACGFLDFDEDIGVYTLGPKIFALGRLVTDRYTHIANMVRPTLARLAEETGDTAFYSVVQGFERLVVARQESTEGVRFVIPEGQARPLHAGATGKVLLAFGQEALRERFLDDDFLASLAPPSRQSAIELATDLARIADDGFAVSRGEATAHGFAVAVPILAGGTLAGALAIAGPLTKLSDGLAEHYVERLRDEVRVLAPLIAAIHIGRGAPETLNQNPGNGDTRS